jgi:hypothetical protein
MKLVKYTFCRDAAMHLPLGISKCFSCRYTATRDFPLAFIAKNLLPLCGDAPTIGYHEMLFMPLHGDQGFSFGICC